MGDDLPRNRFLKDTGSMAHTTIVSTIGHTPMVRLNRVCENTGAEIWAKLEMFNPCGSVKDRIAWNMIRQAEDDGDLIRGMTVVEATSGNTGIGLAMVCAARGYRLILTMPETMSVERKKILRMLGAEIHLSPGDEGMQGAVRRACELQADSRRVFMPGQFDNPANPAAHFTTTGPEIWQAMAGRVDIFVAGVGTGGTITGVSEFLKMKNPSLRTVAVEPAESAVLSGGKPGPHGIQGIGAGFIPSILKVELLDEILTVTTADARAMARRLAVEEGIFAGISCGAAVSGACRIAGRREAAGRRIAVVLPDTGERYLSMTGEDEETD